MPTPTFTKPTHEGTFTLEFGMCGAMDRMKIIYTGVLYYEIFGPFLRVALENGTLQHINLSQINMFSVDEEWK